MGMISVASMTVASVLGDGDPNRAVSAVEQGLQRVEAARAALRSADPLSTAAFRLVDQRVAEALQGQLSTDVGDLVLQGWRKWRELVAAAERSRDAPGQHEEVVLTEHTITSTHRPAVDVIVDGSLVATLTFELTVSLMLRSVIAIVEKGRLTALRGGDVLAGACVSLEGQTLARGECHIAVGVLVGLGNGVALVSGAPTPGPGPAREPASGSVGGARWWDRVAPQQPPQPYQWPKPVQGQPETGGMISSG